MNESNVPNMNCTNSHATAQLTTQKRWKPTAESITSGFDQSSNKGAKAERGEHNQDGAAEEPTTATKGTAPTSRMSPKRRKRSGTITKTHADGDRAIEHADEERDRHIARHSLGLERHEHQHLRPHQPATIARQPRHAQRGTAARRLERLSPDG